MSRHPTPQQCTEIGMLVAKAADSISANAVDILERTRQWVPGPRAANLDPDAGGWRYEEDVDGTVWPVPSDPTGEAAMPHGDAAAHLYARYVRILTDLQRLAGEALEFNTIAVRPDRPATDDPTAWCSNHLRIGVCEPRHRGDLCRWCDDFRREHRNQLPPASLLGARHRGQRITERMVEAAMRELRKKAG